MTNVLLHLIRREGGEASVVRLLESAGVSREPSFLENVENWISLDEATAMLRAGVEESGDANFARRVGENTLRQHAGTQVATVLRSLGSTEAVLTAGAQSAAPARVRARRSRIAVRIRIIHKVTKRRA